MIVVWIVRPLLILVIVFSLLLGITAQVASSSSDTLLRWVANTEQQGIIFTADDGQIHQQPLTISRDSYPVLDLMAAWSPDGMRLVFAALTTPRIESSRAREIWVYDTQSQASKRLLADWVRASTASWSPDGTRLAFDSAISSSAEGLAMTVDLTQPGVPQRVEVSAFNQPIIATREATWSPTNRDQLALIVTQPARRTHIALLDVAAGEVRNLLSADIVAEDLSWSPDGSSLLYYLPPLLNFTPRVRPTYHLLNAETGRWRPLAGSDAVTQRAVWSPDGSLIAMTGPADHRIRLIDPDTGNIVGWIPGSRDGAPERLAWSADSNLLAFSVNIGTRCDLYAADRKAKMTVRVIRADPADCHTTPVWIES